MDLTATELAPVPTGSAPSDPRAENCRAFRMDGAGKVVGVELVHVPNPATPYELARVELLDEYAAGGGTVAKFQVLAGGVATGERVYLAWPFPELSNRLLPGNPNGEHMITNGYDAAKGDRGPLALYVGDAVGGVISDVIGGLGLPNNRHVSYLVTFRARTDEPPGPGTGGAGDEALVRIAAAVERLAAHFSS